MKKNILISALIILFAVCASWQRTEAQEKIPAEKEKEMQEAIDAQKKALIEQQRSQEEMQKNMQDQQQEMNVAIEEAQQKIERARANGSFRVFSDKALRTVPNGMPFVFSGSENEWFHSFNEDVERTTWDFSKSVKETTFSRDYTFDVETTANTVIMSVSGDCKVGDIHIRIVMPNGKTYSDIVIDEFGNLNWRKSFSISETENKDKTGAWKFEISSNKATGFFRISLQTY